MLNQCLAMLKRDDVKKEIKHLFSPVFHVLEPYFYFIYLLILLNIGVSSMILYKLKST